MKEIITQLRHAKDCPPYTKVFVPMSDDDRTSADSFQMNQTVRQKTYGAKKERAYRELCCWKGSSKYIADQDVKIKTDSGVVVKLSTQKAVENFTKTLLGFIDGTYVDPYGGVQFIPKSLCYANCDQPESHRFIAAALEYHASLLGIEDDKKTDRKAVDIYVDELRKLGQGYDGI